VRWSVAHALYGTESSSVPLHISEKGVGKTLRLIAQQGPCWEVTYGNSWDL